MSYKKITTALLLFFLSSCRQSFEERVRSRGVTAPRNHREKIIFDYFNALKTERYADAYKLRDYDNIGTLERFIEENSQHHSSLATEISIGDERKLNSSDDDQCGYSYTVYASHPDSNVLNSGVVSIIAHPNTPEACLMEYNSAFGVHP